MNRLNKQTLRVQIGKIGLTFGLMLVLLLSLFPFSGAQAKINGLITPTATPCPVFDPVPPLVEPLTSPTRGLSQVITIRVFNGESVTVTGESGTFTVTGDFSFANPAQVTIRLLPNVTHHLTVIAKTKPITIGNCHYGPFTLSTTRDRTGAPLTIVQRRR